VSSFSSPAQPSADVQPTPNAHRSTDHLAPGGAGRPTTAQSHEGHRLAKYRSGTVFSTSVDTDEQASARIRRRGADVSDQIEYVSERLLVTFAHSGIDVERVGLFAGPRDSQIASRFAIIAKVGGTHAIAASNKGSDGHARSANRVVGEIFCVDPTMGPCMPENHPVIPRSKTPERGGEDCAPRDDKSSQD